jgi:hypothetical protein
MIWWQFGFDIISYELSIEIYLCPTHFRDDIPMSECLPPLLWKMCFVCFFSSFLGGLLSWLLLARDLFYLSLVLFLLLIRSLRSEAFEDVREFFLFLIYSIYTVLHCCVSIYSVCVLYNWNVGSFLFFATTDYFYRRTDGHLLYGDSE